MRNGSVYFHDQIVDRNNKNNIVDEDGEGIIIVFIFY